MAIQIGAKPDSGFDDPIGMLKDCHRRIESFLGILSVVLTAPRRTLTSEERDAVEAALQYFRTGGQRHTRMKKNRFSHACVRPTRILLRKSAGWKVIIESKRPARIVERLYSLGLLLAN